jgi:lysophospholipase L1-like esterase
MSLSLSLKLVLSPVLVAQALLTRARLPRLPEAEGERRGLAVPPGLAQDPAAARPPLRLLIAGDSSAAGVGVVHQRHALAGLLAPLLAPELDTAVAWQLCARSGLTTAGTLALLQQHAADGELAPADVAVVVTGVNDVVDQVPSARAVAAREALANWLRNAHGVQHVAFAPLPPIHQFPGLPQPLRWMAGADARRHNAALAAWATERARSGGDVSCVPMQVPLNRGVMAHDGFHPGEPVYRYCAAVIAEHLAGHVWPRLAGGFRP